MKLRRKHIEFLDDERNCGNGWIVTLNWGWRFEGPSHEAVRGFNTLREVWQETIEPCDCEECKKHMEAAA